MPRDVAIDFYFREFWDRYSFGQLPDLIAIKAMDLAVNMGPRAAVRVLQRACRACDRQVSDDGLLGPATRKAASECSSDLLLIAMRSEAAGVYRSIVQARPVASKYLNGWLNRAYT